MLRRGMGELMGARQHGMSDAAMDGLQQPHLLDDVREEAALLIETDPELSRHEPLRAAIARRLAVTSIS